MNKFKSLVVKADGSNCEIETDFILRKVGFESDIIHLNTLMHEPKSILGYSFIVFPGGFSYGDYTGSGRIAASIIKHHLLENLETFISQGKLILGICNGFQILVKSGILPNSSKSFKQEVSLIFNDSHKYEDRWVKLQVSDNSVFTKNFEKTIYLPVAHGEGKFIYESNKTEIDDLVVLRYVDEKNKPTMKYPQNPNGSTDSIAAIADESGRVMGLMPHPERFIRKEQFFTNKTEINEPHGIRFFENAFTYIKEEL
ncbi:MAG: phosphoribosylformylglycinamidine synthase I [bacterium]|nr:phosphoribosylformylglycinamidine synthase I [bacterium]